MLRKLSRMNSTIEIIKVEDTIAETFEKNKAQLSGNSEVQAIRQNAISAFLKQGIPTRKNEEYKYSNPGKLFNDNYPGRIAAASATLTSDVVKQFEIPGITQNKIVLLNGVFSKELSSVENLPKDIIISSLVEAFKTYPKIIQTHFAKYADVNSDAFIALNTAFATDGLFVFCPANTVFEQPIQLVNLISANEAAFIQTRNLFVIEKGAEIKFIESFGSVKHTPNVVVNNLTEIVLAENAKVQYYKIQDNCEAVSLVNTTQVHQQSGSHFDTNTVTINSEWVRNNLTIVVDAENCETHLNGLFITQDNQHVDNHTLVDHQKPNCESNQLYKGVLADKSTGVFNGKIYVRKDAQKINAYQSSKNILLSDDATINTKPQLEIYANDVKCSHGSSTGHLNEDALFYLRSRGLGIDSARRLLLFAFAADAINTIRVDALREHLNKLIESKFNN